MGIHIKGRYPLILVFSFVFLAPRDSSVINALKLLAAFSIFYFLPGIFLTRRLLGKCNLISSIFLALITGICFHIVYIYFLSFFRIAFNLPLLLLPGIVFSLLAEIYRVELPKYNPKELYLVLAGLIFFLLTYNISPGEDANGHLLLVNTISETGMLPSTYALYPEIPVSYHMGFHIIVSELEHVAGEALLSATASFCSVFMMFSSYLCVRSISTEEAGLLSGIIVTFGVLPPLYYLTYGTYAIFVLFALQPLVVFLLYSGDKSTSFVPVLSIVLAAAFMSHCSFFLFIIPLLLFLKDKTVISSLFLGLGLSIPYLVRFHLSYSPQEITQLYHLWFIPEIFEISMIAERIGIFVVILGTLGLFLLKRDRLIFFSVWLSSLLLLAITSSFNVEFPFRFLLLANRLVDLLFIPLALLSGIFISNLGKIRYCVIAVLVLCMIPHVYAAPRSYKGALVPTHFAAFPADQEGIRWLQENTDESSIILNDWWTGTGSSWMTSLGKRRMIFPFLYVNDHFLSILDIPTRSRDILWVCLAPDSKESYHLLTEWNVDYIFLSSHTEDRVKWRRYLWNVNEMMESPNFKLCFNRNKTYIFEVKKDEWVHTHLFSIREVTVENSTLYMPAVRESFPVTKILAVSYVDSFNGLVQFWSDRGMVAEIPLLNTGEVTTSVLPLGSFRTLRIVSPHELQVVYCEILAVVSGHTLGDVVLSSDWMCCEYYTLQNEGHIYGFGMKALRIVYKDNSPGNVDINCLRDGMWKCVTIIERKGDGITKEVVLVLPEYHFLDIGIKVYDSPFEVISIEYYKFPMEFEPE
jgi:hypothetical protein